LQTQYEENYKRPQRNKSLVGKMGRVALQSTRLRAGKGKAEGFITYSLLAIRVLAMSSPDIEY